MPLRLGMRVGNRNALSSRSLSPAIDILFRAEVRQILVALSLFLIAPLHI